jgi:Carboxypeptidase regulatory-like domain
MKHLLSIIFMALGCQVLLGQAKLEGNVKDADSGEPIAFATVALSQNGVLVTGTETDFDGFYSIAEIDPGNYDVEIISTGTTPQKIKGVMLNSGKAANIVVKLAPIGCGYDIFQFINPAYQQSNLTSGSVINQVEIRKSTFR